MTDNGNHGGSSYEETDSIALFVGLPLKTAENRQKFYRTINQVKALMKAVVNRWFMLLGYLLQTTFY